MSYLPPDFKAASRDLTSKVRQVREILPQCADDQVCMALAQVDDDVLRAVELLLTAGQPDEPAPVPDPEPPAEPVREAPKAAVREPSPEKVQEKRPPTALEREVLKWRKKLREIEKIEHSLAAGKKVEPLQLVKIERKAEVEAEVIKAELKASAEAAQLAREAREREEAERKERILREKEEARERAEHDRAERERQAREREEARRAAAQEARRPPPRPAPAASRGEAQNAGMELLQMVQGHVPGPANVPPMPTPPSQVDGYGRRGYPPAQGEPRRGEPRPQAQTGGTVLPPPRARAGPTGQLSAAPEAGPAAATRQDISEYTTPLDIKNIPHSVQAKAARVAAEIEREQGHKGGKGFRNDRNDRNDGFTVKGKGKGKGHFDKDGGKGKGQQQQRPQGVNGAAPDSGGFEDWLKERRTQAVARQVRT